MGSKRNNKTATHMAGILSLDIMPVFIIEQRAIIQTQLAR